MECIKANIVFDKKQTIMDVELATMYAVAEIDIKDIEFEVLKVLAVLRRSEVVKKVKNTPYYEKDFELSIEKNKIRKSVKKAVEETEGQVVTCFGKLVGFYYTMCCNGATANSEDILDEKINYLRHIYCDKCQKRDGHRRFHLREYEEETRKRYSFKNEGCGIFSNVERDEEGRIKSLNFLGETMTGKELMMKLNLKSNKIYFKEEVINLKIEGEGDGLGICMEGAMTLSKEGLSYEEIIKYYYTGVDFEMIGSEGANNLVGKVFLLDPGHGGDDKGNSRDGLFESQIALSVGQKLKELIESKKGEVYLTRDEDVSISLTDRAAMANKIKPDFLVSLHLNAFIMPGVNGCEGYCYENDKEAIELAEKILDEIEKSVGIKKRKVNESDLFLLRESRVPSLILECLYITGNKDAEVIDENIEEKLANAIFEGICKYFDIVI
ncbi:MAG: N-acetylmuramoyl-L-alanine amidase [Clostridium sp.]